MEFSLQKAGNAKRRKTLRLDASFWSLLFSNGLAVYFALREHWKLPTLMWLYWSQSVVIGIFNFLRMISLKDFSTDNLLINGRPVRPTRASKIQISFFFLLHYGFFHFVYLIFLMTGAAPARTDRSFILLTAGTFFANHLFSFLHNYKRDTAKQNIGRMMFFPYARIVPMHATIVFGVFLVKTTAGLLFFMGLKTLADIIMHLIEHAEERERSPAPQEKGNAPTAA